MIGVLSRACENAAVQEFFQLFKTPWESVGPGTHYDLVIVTRGAVPQSVSATVVVIYNSNAIGSDDDITVVERPQGTCEWVEWQGCEFPVYGAVATFKAHGHPLVTRRDTREIVGSTVVNSKRTTVRLGFDVFYEVEFLLSRGQPPENARIPTLDIHISLLRAILVHLGVSFVEVPPLPAGYDFAGCLTHDVDFVGIRDHVLDHTMWGFLYRSLFSSFSDALRGRLAWSKCFRNWRAALVLPLVYLGWREDFWLEFKRYMERERGCGSTFFFIPFKNVAGTLANSSAPKRRAAKYDLMELKEELGELINNGCEIGLHGVNAWLGVGEAQLELDRIREITGAKEIGTRMHWLYWQPTSPRALEEAGFVYDSTFGYNDAVGFRAGTTQPFCPLSADRLLELQLNIQDTAMFYSDRMMLSQTEALKVCRELVNSTVLWGGALTVNWHTRSLSPERLWGDFYVRLLGEMQTHRVWFGTAQEVVGWFRARRALRFDSSTQSARVLLSSPSGRSEPAFTVRVYEASQCREHYWNGEGVVEVSLGRDSRLESSAREEIVRGSDVFE